MLKKPQKKRELIKLLQEIDDFNVLLVEYRKVEELIAKLRMLRATKEIAIIAIGVR